MSRARILDHTGFQYGQWTVVKRLNVIDNRRMYLCRCKCGYEKIRPTGHLKKTLMCPQCRCKLVSEMMKKEKGSNSRNSVLHSYKKGAKNRRLAWELTDQQALKLMNEKCFYCGREPYREYTASRANGGFKYNGIDRIDNSKVYTIDNTCSCCPQCNFAKRTLSYNDFINVVKLIYKNLSLGEVYFENVL